jgi:insulysin
MVDGVEKLQFDLKKSPGDKNEYDYFRLTNGLNCLLINDKNQIHQVSEESENKPTMAYFALSVNVGSFNDPENRPGLAHFLEHMIFIGSEKY